MMSNRNPERYLSDFGSERIEEIARERAERIDDGYSVVRHYAAQVCGLVALGGGIGLVLTVAWGIAVAVGMLDSPPLGEFWKPVLSNLVWLYGFGRLSEYVDNPEVTA